MLFLFLEFFVHFLEEVVIYVRKIQSHSRLADSTSPRKE